MPQSVEDILAKAKAVSQQAEQKFPSAGASAITGAGKAITAKPSYAQVPTARKAASGIGAELKAKGEMVQKGRDALK
jgi:hypothetical protein